MWEADTVGLASPVPGSTNAKWAHFIHGTCTSTCTSSAFLFLLQNLQRILVSPPSSTSSWSRSTNYSYRVERQIWFSGTGLPTIRTIRKWSEMIRNSECPTRNASEQYQCPTRNASEHDQNITRGLFRLTHVDQNRISRGTSLLISSASLLISSASLVHLWLISDCLTYRNRRSFNINYASTGTVPYI